MKKRITLSSKRLKLADVIAVARHAARARLSDQARTAVEKTGRLIEHWLDEGRAIYGVTTGFGALSDVSIRGRMPTSCRSIS
jgi:histidine ammonia-lyase